MASILVTSLSNWFIQHVKKSHNDENFNGINLDTANDADERLLELACHIIKKCWPLLVEATVCSEESAQSVHQFIQSVCWLCIKVRFFMDIFFLKTDII